MRLGAVVSLITLGFGCASNAPADRADRSAPAAPESSASAASSVLHPEAISSSSPSSADSSTPGPTPGPAAPNVPAKPRIYSVGQTSWIRKKPEVKAGQFLGYVRTGSSIALRSNELVQGVGCPRGFYQVEPRGYVCADRTVTDEPPEPFRRAAEATRAGSGPFPYRYALSGGAPMYNRIPTKKEQARYEPSWSYQPGVIPKLPKTLRSHEELAVAAEIEATEEIPSFLREGGSAKAGAYDLVEQRIPLGSMLSYTAAFEAEGRTWLLSTDHTIVPADRVRPFEPSTFRGVDLHESDTKLPIAWMRVTAKPQYRIAEDAFEKTGKTWAVRTHIGLTGKSREASGETYLETRDAGEAGSLWIAADDATVVEAQTDRPHGVKEGQKWFLIRLTQGTLVAYDDLEPVYSTLVSPGQGGVPVPGRDNVRDSTTPLGAYSITFKDRVATMSPEKGKDRSFWIQDVPHTQYFDPPFALHAAYWHERFGELVSAGCVNLSPIDAEILFHWSDPKVPVDWQGATGAGAKENGGTTIVVIRR